MQTKTTVIIKAKSVLLAVLNAHQVTLDLLRSLCQNGPLLQRFEHLLVHNPEQYALWKDIYEQYFCKNDRELVESLIKFANKKPTEANPASIPHIAKVSQKIIDCFELCHLCEEEYHGIVPIISIDLIKEFLAHVHAFTTVGLEGQALGYSYEDGPIRHLVILPQVNKVSTVYDAPYSVVSGQDIRTALAKKDSERELTVDPQKYKVRCWIHTHPRFNAFMSSLDIHQLYANATYLSASFGIVISPRIKGLKLLLYT